MGPLAYFRELWCYYRATGWTDKRGKQDTEVDVEGKKCWSVLLA